VGVADRAIVVERFESGGSHDDDPLLPAIDRAVRAARLTPRDLRAVAVSRGPGGFTGLRIAVTATKCLCDALGIQAIAVPSALVAAAASRVPGPRLVALAAKRTTAWITRVEGDGSESEISGEPGILDVDGIRALDLCRGATALLADSFVPQAIIDHAKNAGLVHEEPSFLAESLLAIATRWFERGRTISPLHLTPIYPREPEAVTLWNERHGQKTT
jgi:tRNA threonylcarbamoyladenosine biosynthesis protein TsaB